MQLSEISAVILAGGRSQRMGSQNKGLIPLGGQALIAHVIARLSPQIPRIVISANHDLDAYREFGLPVIPDQIGDHPGPLGGIYSALQTENSEWLITVPCDTPILPDDYVQRMCAAVDTQLAYVARDSARQQSGFCLLHRKLLPLIEQQLQTKQFALHRFLSAADARTVDFSDQSAAFVNINTPGDLASFMHKD